MTGFVQNKTKRVFRRPLVKIKGVCHECGAVTKDGIRISFASARTSEVYCSPVCRDKGLWK